MVSRKFARLTSKLLERLFLVIAQKSPDGYKLLSYFRLSGVRTVNMLVNLLVYLRLAVNESQHLESHVGDAWVSKYFSRVQHSKFRWDDLKVRWAIAYYYRYRMNLSASFSFSSWLWFHIDHCSSHQLGNFRSYIIKLNFKKVSFSGNIWHHA